MCIGRRQGRRHAASGLAAVEELATRTCQPKQRRSAHLGVSAADLSRDWRRNAIRPVLWQVHQPDHGVLDDKHAGMVQIQPALEDPQALTAKRVNWQSDDDELTLAGRSWCIVFDW